MDSKVVWLSVLSLLPSTLAIFLPIYYGNCPPFPNEDEIQQKAISGGWYEFLSTELRVPAFGYTCTEVDIFTGSDDTLVINKTSRTENGIQTTIWALKRNHSNPTTGVYNVLVGDGKMWNLTTIQAVILTDYDNYALIWATNQRKQSFCTEYAYFLSRKRPMSEFRIKKLKDYLRIHRSGLHEFYPVTHNACPQRLKNK